MKAMRSFHGVSAALLEQCLSTGSKTFEQIEQYLDTARLRQFPSSNTPRPQFELAEREGDIYLKQLTIECMMKQFFLAGHIWYARYLTQYLLEMRVLHAEARRTLSVGITMDTGMLSLPTRLVSKLPSRWAKELSKA